MKMSVLLRAGCLAKTFMAADIFAEDVQIVVQAMLLEMTITSVFFLRFARWEDQEHWITLWQTLYTLEFLCVRMVLYNNASWLIFGMLGLYATYFIGLYAE